MIQLIELPLAIVGLASIILMIWIWTDPVEIRERKKLDERTAFGMQSQERLDAYRKALVDDNAKES